MYQKYYGLTEKPFNLTPDPRFLYLSKKHKEAFAHLMYGIRHRSGFVMVSGEIGTGKTTICRSLLKQLDPDIEVALVFNPYLSPKELLKCINKDFGIESESTSVLELIEELNVYLLKQASKGKNCVLIIDEAQNLSSEILEQIRLLSNLETEKEKLIQIMLIGQPELAQKLELYELRQLNQRITARYHLEALSEDETLHYVAFRLRVAGGRKKVRFSRKAIRAIYKVSQGTPRVINALCDRALLIGYTQELHEITPKVIKLATKEIHGAKHIRIRKLDIASILRTTGALTSAAVVLLIVLFTSGPISFPKTSSDTPPSVAIIAAPTVHTLIAGSQVNAITHTQEAPNLESDPQDPLAQLQENLTETHNVESAPETSPVLPPPTPAATPAPTNRIPKISVPESTIEKTLPMVVIAEEATPLSEEGIELPKTEAVAKENDTPPELIEPFETTASPETTEVTDLPEEILVVSIPDAPQEPEEIIIKTIQMPSDLQLKGLRRALDDLLNAWSVSVETEYPSRLRYQDIVEFAVAHGFGSNQLESTLSQLIVLNYPAILKIDIGEGSHWVALTKLEDSTATISSDAEKTQALPLLDLESAYQNEAIIFWQDSSATVEPLREADQGEDVWKLQHTLANLGILKSEPNGVYGPKTAEAISNVQKACGLLVDGIYGTQTRMVLTGWLDDSAPPHLIDTAFPSYLLETLVARVVTPQEPIELTIPVEESFATKTTPAAPPQTYEPLIPKRHGPSSDSVTQPAQVIVPLVPSQNKDKEGAQ